MKIYVGHSTELNFKEDLYFPLRESKLNSKHEIILPHEANDFVTKDIIKECDVMIAEVSYPSIGLGIELGWADSFNRPIICIYRQDAKISGSLKIVCQKFIEYTDKNDLIKKLETALTEFQN